MDMLKKSTLILLLGSMLTTSCAKSQKPQQPPVSQGKTVLTNPGYYLPATAFDIEITVSYEQRQVAVKNGDKWEPQPCNFKWLTDSQLKITPVTIADQTHFYEIAPNAGFFSELDYTLNFTEDGRLAGINSKSTGKAGGFVTSIGSFIGRVLPFLAGGLGEEHDFASACAEPSKAEANAKQWFNSEFASNDEYEDVKADLEALKSSINKARAQRRFLLGAIDGNLAEKDKALERMTYAEMLEKVTGELEKDLASLKSVKAAQYSAFKTKHGLKSVISSLSEKKQFTVKELLAIVNIQDSEAENKLSLNKCGHPLENLQTLWNCTRTVPRLVTNVDFSQIQAPTPQEVNAAASSQSLTIVSRRPYPMLLEVLEWEGNPDVDGGAGTFSRRIKSTTPVNVLVPNSDGVIHVLDKSAWKEQKLALTYNASGVVSKIEAIKGGGADIFAKSLDDTLKGGLTAYQETLTGLSAIKTKEAEIANAANKAKLTELQTQKQILDEQIAIDSKTATQEQLVEKASLDAQIAVLESKVKVDGAVPDLASETVRLQTELANLQARVNLDNAKNPAPPSELARLKAEIELLQQQQILDKLNETPTPPPPPTETELLQIQVGLLRLQIEQAQLLKQLQEATQ